MSEEKSKTVVPRVTQLDAIEFDNEILTLLKTCAVDATKSLVPGFIQNFEKEFTLLIQLLILKTVLLRRDSTYGQELLGVKYDKRITNKLSFLYGLLLFGIPYGKEKLDDWLLSTRNHRLKKITDTVDASVRLCSIVNLLYFLREGVYPTLADRILGLRYTAETSLNTNVGYTYMTRELLWHGFMELLVVTLPLINYRSWKRRFFQLFSLSKKDQKLQQSAQCDVNTTCAFCNDAPVLPCQISLYCKHVACYYCVKGNVLADEKFLCPICGEENTCVDNIQFVLK